MVHVLVGLPVPVLESTKFRSSKFRATNLVHVLNLEHNVLKSNLLYVLLIDVSAAEVLILAACS